MQNVNASASASARNDVNDVIVRINISSIWRNIKIYLAIIGFVLFVSIANFIVETLV